ncbi:MAG TPA: hypothetical protein DGT23_19610 [Micromonosporaceae bacterium]|nr:hypothetical protein [Micromonosporaceae bacterium]
MGRPPGQALQPGIGATGAAEATGAAGSPDSSPALSAPPTTASAPAGGSFSAAFAVSESYEGGYIGSITIKSGAGGLSDWTAEIELPPGGKVTSAWDRTSFQRTGKQVVFTPEEPHRQIPSNGQFTFFFQVGKAGPPLTCSVNGVPCVGISS